MYPQEINLFPKITWIALSRFNKCPIHKFLVWKDKKKKSQLFDLDSVLCCCDLRTKHILKNEFGIIFVSWVLTDKPRLLMITFFFLSFELVESRWSALPSSKTISSHSLFKVFLPLLQVILNQQLLMVLTSELCFLKFNILLLRITLLPLFARNSTLAIW